jgi:hypothetical protein
MTSSLSNYQINLNSLNRFNYNGTNSNVCEFKIQDIIMFQNKRKIFLTLPHLCLPPTIYNISSLSGNNTLTFIEDTVPSTVPLTMTATLVSGNYSVSDFISALATQMTVQSGISGYSQTYTGSYNSSTGQITMYMLGAPAGFQLKAYTFLGEDQDLKKFLGFNSHYNNFTVVNPTANYTFTGFGPANFSTPDAIYVRCSIVRTDASYDTYTTNNIGGPSNILRIVPITSNGFIQLNFDNYEGLEAIRQEVSNNDLTNNSIKISFTSSNPNFLIDMANFDWSGTLQVNYSIALIH